MRDMLNIAVATLVIFLTAMVVTVLLIKILPDIITRPQDPFECDCVCTDIARRMFAEPLVAAHTGNY